MATIFVQDSLVFGDVDTVGSKISEVVSMEPNGITVYRPVKVGNLERVALLGEIGRKVLG